MDLLDDIRAPGYAEAVSDRVEELLWVLDHLDDLDADFLAIYNIDLEHDEISARRYFALAQRLTAYQGVMAARVDEEREQQHPSSTPTRTSSTPATAPRDDSNVEVSLTQFRALYPGWVSVAQGG